MLSWEKVKRKHMLAYGLRCRNDRGQMLVKFFGEEDRSLTPGLIRTQDVDTRGLSLERH